jgi:hypothetical protein
MADNKQPDRSFSDKYSSRIKKVMIQLHDYHFYHGPYKEIFGDNRFIGRKAILTKLKSLFTSSEYKSGVYLITGYRGSGKTSVVNKAIDEINNHVKPLKGNKLAYFLVLLFYIFLAIFFYKYTGFSKGLTTLLWTCVALFSMRIVYIIINVILKPPYIPHWYSWYNFIFDFFRKHFHIRNLKHHEKKPITSYFPWISLTLVPVIVTSIVLSQFYETNNLNSILVLNWLCGVFYIMVILNVVYNSYQTLPFKGFNQVKAGKFISGLFRFNANIFIKLNLGQRKLHEIDILRLLARNLKTEYSKYYKHKTFSQLLVSVGIFYFIYSISYIVYYDHDIYVAHNKLKVKCKIVELLPSQNDTLLFWDGSRVDNRKKLYKNIIDLYENPFVNSEKNQIINQDQNQLINKKQSLVMKKEQNQLISKTNEQPIKNDQNQELNKDQNQVLNKDRNQVHNKDQNQMFNEDQNQLLNIQHKTVVEYVWDKISFAVSFGITLVDSYLFIAYQEARHILVDGVLLGIPDQFSKPINKVPGSSGMQFSLIPYHLDYFFLSYIFLLYIIIKRVLINGLFLSKRPKKIRKKIEDLNDIIVSEMTVDKLSISSEHSSFNIFTFFSPKTKKRTVADVKEIEKTLIDILDDIDRIRFPYSRPDIIVVFDELDKIETHTYLYERPLEERREAELAASPLNKNPNPSFTIDGTRERQQTLQILLSNLKYFLSDAKAKFIFIAGREMYDASLADISDRNYFMGSIFHEVININSFLSDNTDKRPSDITGMIERYVCQFLIPKDYITYYKKQKRKKDKIEAKQGRRNYTNDEQIEFFTLKVFNSYLVDTFPDMLDEANTDIAADKILARQKREKILNLMQRFIIYLTHASNGAPKKVTNYFENFVQFRTIEDIEKKDIIPHYIYVSMDHKKTIKHRECAYLVFNYNKQYELGLINYITLPIILTISNHIKNFGDKLLVSATFLCDHLLKFHRDGFSWRNIEYIPEILEINRTPELRAFINNILDFLLQTHLQTILSGLYTFRFNQRLSKEISFLSKVSEEASASFNFTLDESLAIKHYYHSLLFRLEERYRKITSDRTEYIHSIAMVHAVLGDLYFYDEEYNDAILEYMDSIQYLRYSDFSDENFSLLLVLIRNMLKLGLSFEKRKTYNSAFETYKELCYLLIKRRDIDLKEFGLEERSENGEIIITSPDVSDYHKKKDIYNEWVARRAYKEEYTLRNRFKESFPFEFNNRFRNNEKEFERDIFFSDKDNFINKLTEHLTPNVEKILGKIISFEGIRLIYQPLLARLQMMEKCVMGGITKIDVFRTEQEFYYLQKAINQKDKVFLRVEFYNKVGDILFFKRGKIKFKNEKSDEICPCWKPILNENTNEKDQDIIYHLKHIIVQGEKKNKQETQEIEGPDLECAACLFYKKSVELYVRNNLHSIDPDKPLNLSDCFANILSSYDSFSASSQTSVRILAETISDLADAKLGCINQQFQHSDFEILKMFLVEPKNFTNDSKTINGILNFSSSGILRMFYLSALFYKKGGEYKEYVWQLTKILYFVKEIIQYFVLVSEKTPSDFPEEDGNQILKGCEDNIVKRAIRGCWSAYENAHMNEVPKQKDIINSRSTEPKNTNEKKTTLNRISVNNDIEEITALFTEIKMLMNDLFPKSKAKKVQKEVRYDGIVVEHYLKNLVSPFSDADSVYNRILRLNFKVKLNYRMFLNIIPKQLEIDRKELSLNILNDKDHKEESFWRAIFIKFINSIVPKGDLFSQTITLYSEDNKEGVFKDIIMYDLFCHLIADSIYCLNEIIEISNAYGKSYILNHSSIAAAHEKMIYWLAWYEAIENFKLFTIVKEDKILNQGKPETLENSDQTLEETKITDQVNPETPENTGQKEVIKIDVKQRDLLNTLKYQIRTLLESLMDKDSLQAQSISYHSNMMLRRYYSAYETHIEGNAYKNFIERMIFLNDDFNDKLSHFFTAYERFSFNNKEFDKKIENQKKYNKSSAFNKYDNFINTQV